MYLKNTQELHELLELGEKDSSSHVVLNEKSEGTSSDALPMSTVLSEVLSGPTRSFTALVGWFGHGGAADEESPAKIILDEARDDNIEVGSDIHSVFRLAVGVNSSADARDASRAWYWLCRYRHEYEGEGVEQTDRLRDEFLEASRHDFVGASKGLLSKTPFALEPEQFAERLQPNRELGETPEEILKALKATLYPRVNSTPQDEEEPFGEAAAVLLGFLMQRRGDFRFNPKSKDGVTRVFHPKMYVVEQEYEPSDGRTVSMVGSHNWTQAALGTTDSEGVVSTVEVATIHVDSGHAWGEPSSGHSLGHRVCGTAKHLFESSEYILGSWEEAAGDRLLPASELGEITTKINTFKFEKSGWKKRREGGERPELPRAFRELIPLKEFVTENMEEERASLVEDDQTLRELQRLDQELGGLLKEIYQ